jgi:hypothetical protein
MQIWPCHAIQDLKYYKTNLNSFKWQDNIIAFFIRIKNSLVTQQYKLYIDIDTNITNPTYILLYAHSAVNRLCIGNDLWVLITVDGRSIDLWVLITVDGRSIDLWVLITVDGRSIDLWVSFIVGDREVSCRIICTWT